MSKALPAALPRSHPLLLVRMTRWCARLGYTTSDTRRKWQRRAFIRWTPRELRHSFVSLMSDADVPIEKIARLVGHTGTTTTETVYRKQIRPVVIGGAEVMDSLFPGRDADA